MHINSSETRYKSTNSNFDRSTTEFRKKLVIKYIDFKVQQIRWKRWFVALNMLLNINLICTTINLYMRWSRPEHSHNLFKSVWAINSERQTKLFFFFAQRWRNVWLNKHNQHTKSMNCASRGNLWFCRHYFDLLIRILKTIWTGILNDILDRCSQVNSYNATTQRFYSKIVYFHNFFSVVCSTLYSSFGKEFNTKTVSQSHASKFLGKHSHIIYSHNIVRYANFHIKKYEILLQTIKVVICKIEILCKIKFSSKLDMVVRQSTESLHKIWWNSKDITYLYFFFFFQFKNHGNDHIFNTKK